MCTAAFLKCAGMACSHVRPLSVCSPAVVGRPQAVLKKLGVDESQFKVDEPLHNMRLIAAAVAKHPDIDKVPTLSILLPIYAYASV